MVESINDNYNQNSYRDFRIHPHGSGEISEKPANTIRDNYHIEENGENQGENVERTGIREEQPNVIGKKNEGKLTEAEKRKLQGLKKADRKVRQHEMAHLSAAQGIAISGANFEYERGPDGVNYAVGGDVRIDTSRESDPEATIDKARRIVTAALAPIDPSPQDRQVAARARMMEMTARMELMQEKHGEAKEEKIHPGIETYDKNQASFGGAEGFTPPIPILDLVA